MTKEEMKIVEIEHTINVNIESAKIEFKQFGSSDYYNRLYSRICGMIEVLQIITGKDYYFDENGLHERKRIKISERPNAANGYKCII